LVPDCPEKCVTPSEKYRLYKAKRGSSKPITCALQMQKEIMANGPVQTGFMVFEDFLHYKNGIYKALSKKQLGGHAIRVVGWGQEDGVDFWIAANSWGPKWGEKGHFRIAFGECMFEENGFAGQADPSRITKMFMESD
jgi:cathepsin B